MARLNLDDSIFKEQGFQDLLIASGNRHLAKGYVVELYELAQKYWFPNRKPIPLDVFEASGLPEVIYAKGGLARLTEEGVYARGSEERFAWLFQKSEAGKKKKKKKTSKKATVEPEPECEENGSDDNARIAGDNTRSSGENVREHPRSSYLFSLFSYLFSHNSNSNSFLNEIPAEQIRPHDSLQPEDLLFLWGQARGPFSAVAKFSKARRDKARSQLRRYPDATHWAQVMARFRWSKFCEEEWKPTFDDFLSETKRIRALEGKYDFRNRDEGRGAQGPQTSDPFAFLDEVANDR